MRDVIEFAAAYGSVAEELEGVAKGIRNTIAARRSEVGVAALQAYAIAARMAKIREHAALIPHVGEMKRTIGRGRGRAVPKPSPTPKS